MESNSPHKSLNLTDYQYPVLHSFAPDTSCKVFPRTGKTFDFFTRFLLRSGEKEGMIYMYEYAFPYC